MALKRKGKRDIMRDEWFLKANPFSGIDMYNVDRPHTYVPEIFGDRLKDFYEKFFILPLGNEKHKQVIGALWSSHSADQWGKGFGKSILMAEESKRINADFGASMLKSMDVEDEDVQAHPVLAGYCTFDESKGITSFPATLLEAVGFILNSDHGDHNVHAELLRRAAESIGARDGYEGETVQRELVRRLSKFRGLSIQLTHRSVNGFVQRLCHDDTSDLLAFIQNEIGPRIKANQGFHFIHIFNTFAQLSGITYIVYFIDQVENFARLVRSARQEKDMKIIRESMCQTSPTSDIASFIFQMHLHAQEQIEHWWEIEDLPGINYDDPRDSTRVVDLNGLGVHEAKILAEKYLADYRLEGVSPPDPLHPFSFEIIEAVCHDANGNPRDILRTLNRIIDRALIDERAAIDLTYIEPLLSKDYAEPEQDSDDEDEFSNVER